MVCKVRPDVYSSAVDNLVPQSEQPVKLDRQLRDFGFAVIPNCVREVEKTRAALQGALYESPEFSKACSGGEERVKGAFQAMGNPSSFHLPILRHMRSVMHAAVLKAGVFSWLLEDGMNLEQLFDRVLIRPAGKQITGETMHRDEAKGAKDSDHIFGGGVNLDKTPQTFNFCPQSHILDGTVKKQNGFAKIEADTDEYNFYDGRMRQVKIPSGALLIFYEHIVHEICTSCLQYETMRMFFGWRLTFDSEPLFGMPYLKNVLSDQAVPKLKSGQTPPMYPKMTISQPKRWSELEEWSSRTFVKEFLTERKLNSTKFPELSRAYSFVEREMSSLRRNSKGLKRKVDLRFKKYNKREKSVHVPGRKWQLRTSLTSKKRSEFEV